MNPKATVVGMPSEVVSGRWDMAAQVLKAMFRPSTRSTLLLGPGVAVGAAADLLLVARLAAAVTVTACLLPTPRICQGTGMPQRVCQECMVAIAAGKRTRCIPRAFRYLQRLFPCPKVAFVVRYAYTWCMCDGVTTACCSR
jgi:hypothetical protein